MQQIVVLEKQHLRTNASDRELGLIRETAKGNSWGGPVINLGGVVRQQPYRVIDVRVEFIGVNQV